MIIKKEGKKVIKQNVLQLCKEYFIARENIFFLVKVSPDDTHMINPLLSCNHPALSLMKLTARNTTCLFLKLVKNVKLTWITKQGVPVV